MFSNLLALLFLLKYFYYFLTFSLSGLSPFLGDNDSETLSNVTAGEVDFDDECFDDITDDAKSFILSLLVKDET